MSYDDVISHVVDVVEGAGAAIMVLGALGAFALFARRVRRGGERAYQQLREDVGRVILLGLESYAPHGLPHDPRRVRGRRVGRFHIDALTEAMTVSDARSRWGVNGGRGRAARVRGDQRRPVDELTPRSGPPNTRVG